MKNRLLNFEKLKFEVRKAMRYDDVGDYFDHTIIAYDMGDPIMNNAILLHEFIEYMLIKSAGIPSELIDKFDTDETYEKKYPNEFALYSKFHRMANRVERQFVENLGYNWEDYDNTIYSVPVAVAVQKVTDDLHHEKPSEEQIKKSRKLLRDIFRKRKKEVK